MQAETLRDIGKRDPDVQNVALQDLDDAGNLQSEIRQYDPRHDERDMVRLGKTQELMVSTFRLAATAIRSVRLTSVSVASASSPSSAMRSC